MNNGHGRFTSADAKEYIAGVSRFESFAECFLETQGKLVELLGKDFDGWWDSYPSTMSKGEFLPIMQQKVLELEQNALRDSIVADCTEQVTHFTSAIAGAYIVDGEHPVVEAQQIERQIDATLHAEDLGTRNIISGGEVLELGTTSGHDEDIF